MKKNYRHFEIGNFKSDAKRGRPTVDRVKNYLKSMSNAMKDYDVYLWGSWPEKSDTWDADFLFSNPDLLDTEKMERISIKSLRNSLVKNNFLADVGFTDQPVVPFNTIHNNYKNTGKLMPNSGYVYADKWFQNGRLFKDRGLHNEGRMERMGNNILKLTGGLPYRKMINTINDGTFTSIYGGKPELIQRRRKIYG